MVASDLVLVDFLRNLVEFDAVPDYAQLLLQNTVEETVTNVGLLGASAESLLRQFFLCRYTKIELIKQSYLQKSSI